MPNHKYIQIDNKHDQAHENRLDSIRCISFNVFLPFTQISIRKKPEENHLRVLPELNQVRLT